MTRSAAIDPERVLISKHAVQRFLLRYPSDVLPRHPEREIRALLALAHPMTPREARRWRHALRRCTTILSCSKWVFPITPAGPDRTGYTWVLPTVLRREPHVNHALTARQERIRNWAAFQDGTAERLLLGLVAELGTTDLHELRREWHRRAYPQVVHGGYPTFDEFWRAKARLLQCAARGDAAAP